MSDELLRRAKVALANWRPDLIAENCRWEVISARRDAYGGIILVDQRHDNEPSPQESAGPSYSETIHFTEVESGLWMGCSLSKPWGRTLVLLADLVSD